MVFPGQLQRKADNKHSLYRSTRSDKQALTHMGKSSPVGTLQLYYRSSTAALRLRNQKSLHHVAKPDMLLRVTDGINSFGVYLNII